MGAGHLVVVPNETGGHWDEEAVKNIRSLASALSPEAQQPLQRSAFLAWRRPWTRMLALSCRGAFAGSVHRTPNPHAMSRSRTRDISRAVFHSLSCHQSSHAQHMHAAQVTISLPHFSLALQSPPFNQTINGSSADFII